MPNVISVPEKGDESLLKVQIVPGKTMEIDCNKHGLQGKYERKMLENGDTYFVFLSKGEVVSTLMACPDNTKRSSFVPGPTIFTEYNSARPFVVYTPHGIGLKYRIWQAGEMYPVGKQTGTAIQNDAAEALDVFPQTREGYDRYVLLLPEQAGSQQNEYKVEIVPGKTEEVDCNIHRLNGTFSTETVQGWGYQYLVFQSDGRSVSTRKACPDGQRKKELIYGQTETLSYNNNLPVVVFVPKGLEVRYRIWESPRIEL